MENFLLASRFILLLCFIGYVSANIYLFSFFIKKKAILIQAERRRLLPFEKLAFSHILLWFTIIISATCLYIASLVQALIRIVHEEKSRGHKICDSVFILLVRI